MWLCLEAERREPGLRDRRGQALSSSTASQSWPRMSGTVLCTLDQFGMNGVPIGSFRNSSPASMIAEANSSTAVRCRGLCGGASLGIEPSQALESGEAGIGGREPGAD